MTSKVLGSELRQAAFHGDADEILQMWDQYGTRLDVDWGNVYGDTALHLLAWKGEAVLARFLISTCCANVNAQNAEGNTPLILAVQGRKVKCVETLLELGADPHLCGYRNQSALDFASKDHCAGSILGLLENAARPMVKSASKT